MTLVVAFRRKVRNGHELVFGSDSRLTGGQTNDQAQKIFQLPRNDALFAFAGDTQYAYPLLMQLLRSIESLPPSAEGRMKLSKAKGHILRVFQQSYSSIHSLPFGQKYPEEPAARKYAIIETNRLLRRRGKVTAEINYEPLEVLGKIISDRNFPSIGGAPQVGKVYQYLQTQLFQVKWRHDSSSKEVCHIIGRPLLPTENCSWPIFDPDRGFYVPGRSYKEEAE